MSLFDRDPLYDQSAEFLASNPGYKPMLRQVLKHRFDSPHVLAEQLTEATLDHRLTLEGANFLAHVAQDHLVDLEPAHKAA